MFEEQLVRESGVDKRDLFLRIKVLKQNLLKLVSVL